VFLDGRWDHKGPIVTIVGTRNASDDGWDVAYRLARDLAERGVAIVSGLARGIDAAAHRGALDVGGVSGAVLGTPLDTVYPPEHASLHERLRDSLGLMSELEPGDPPMRNTFAARNRMLAAMAHAVIVVQGRAGSGALITADAAWKLKRPVGAIPWDSRDPLGEAPHGLIRSGRAMLVRDADDVMNLVHPGTQKEVRPTRSRRTSIDPASLSSHERTLYEALRDIPLPMDSLTARAGLSAADLGVALVALELQGLAVRVPGGSAKRVRR